MSEIGADQAAVGEAFRFIRARLYEIGVAEGRLVSARRFIIRNGIRKPGMPTPAMIAKLEQSWDLDRLRFMFDQIIENEVRPWDELGIDEL